MMNKNTKNAIYIINTYISISFERSFFNCFWILASVAAIESTLRTSLVDSLALIIRVIIRAVISVRTRYSNFCSASDRFVPHEISSTTLLISECSIPIFERATKAIASINNIPASLILASRLMNSGIWSSIRFILRLRSS